MAIPAIGATGQSRADELYEYGAYLASECTTCHRIDGQDEGIPPIVGWPEGDFVAVLDAFREGERTNITMRNVAGSLGSEEIAALARFFNQVAKTAKREDAR